MRLSLSVESSKHVAAATPFDRERGWRLVVEQWRQARESRQPELAKRAEAMLAVFVALTGEDEATRRNELKPIVTEPVGPQPPSSPSPLPMFREGRSTPPPPPHPGAQRPVEDSADDHQ